MTRQDERAAEARRVAQVADGTSRLIEAIEERLDELATAPQGAPSALLATALEALPASLETFAALVGTQMDAAYQDLELSLQGEADGRSALDAIERQLLGLELLTLNMRAFRAMLALRESAVTRGWSRGPGARRDDAPDA